MKREVIVLDMFSLKGDVRREVNGFVQRSLFSLGVRWATTAPPKNSEVSYTDASALIIRFEDNSEGEVYPILYFAACEKPYPPVGSEMTVFDVAQAFEVALRYVAEKIRAYMSVRRTIEGVHVTITPNTISFDTQELVQRVERQARVIQNGLFRAKE